MSLEADSSAPALPDTEMSAQKPTGTEPSVNLHPRARVRRPARNQPSRQRYWLRRTVVLSILGALVAAGWLATTAVLARSSLLRAQLATNELKADLERGDADSAARRLTLIRAATRRARSLTSSPVWLLAGAIPVAGDTPRTVRGLAREADELSSAVLPDLVAAASGAGGGALRNGDTINVVTLRAMHQHLESLSPALEGIRRRSAALPDGLLLTPVARGREKLIRDVGTLLRTTTQLRDATAIAPAMLGADGPRRYFVALQTNAELRGSGGLLGAYAIVEADAGRITLTRLGANTELTDTYPGRTPGLAGEFDERYGQFGADGFWLNANMSADFPTVSRIWTSMFERTTGLRVDGSIAVDSTALAQILKATGPATGPSGEQVGADNIVALTGQQIYARYPAFAQDALRNALQLEIARALYGRLVAPVSHDVGLLPQLGAAAATGHVHLSSNHPDEQAVLERTSLAGSLPALDGPYLNVAINNAGGTKLDYYLGSSITYSFETAGTESQAVSATVRLRNNAPTSGLPEYVVIRPDLPQNKALVAGQNREYISVYAGRGAILRGASLDGQAIELTAGTERGHPVWSTFVTLDPGQERTLVLALTERGTSQRVSVVAPPTVAGTTVAVLGGVRR